MARDSMMPKKIPIAVYACAHPGWGGSFQYAASILAGLARLDQQKFEVKVWYHDPAWIDTLKTLPVQTVSVPLRLRDRWYGLGVRALRIVKARRYWPTLARAWERLHLVTAMIDAWHPAICVNLQQTSLNLSPDIRQISPIHDLMHLYEPGFEEVGANPEWDDRQWLFSGIAQRCSAILTDGQVGKRHVIETYPFTEGKVHVLPFIAPRSLSDATPVRPQALSPAVEEGAYLFYPAHFWSHKNHKTLLEAVALLPHLGQIHCVFTGTTNKNGYDEVVKTIERLNLGASVHTLGYVSDGELSWLYGNARCMVMPTFLGPTNIPPLEAMSLGCPVAVSAVYGMPDQLGDAALYFDPKQPSSIAQAIETLWTSQQQRDELRAKGQDRIRRWGPEQFETAFLEILKGVLDQTPSVTHDGGVDNAENPAHKGHDG